MSLKIIETDAATADLDNLDDYLTDNAGEDVAFRFVEATIKAYALLVSMPGAGTPRDYDRPYLKGLRMFPIPHFPNHLIFYRYSDTAVTIVRVFHGAQNIEALLSE